MCCSPWEDLFTSLWVELNDYYRQELYHASIIATMQVLCMQPVHVPINKFIYMTCPPGHKYEICKNRNNLMVKLFLNITSSLLNYCRFLLSAAFYAHYVIL